MDAQAPKQPGVRFVRGTLVMWGKAHEHDCYFWGELL